MKLTTKLTALALLLACGLGWNSAIGQVVYEFNPAGATGNIGPTQFMLDTAYAGTSLDGDVTSVGGIQYWVVPSTGAYLIEGFGGQGYGPFGGRGAHISGEFNLFAGDTLKILVGQLAGHYLNYPATTYNHQYGGGGGSFVTTMNNTPLIVAGGGGGNHGNSYVTSCDGQISTNGAAGANATGIGAGGANGLGGQQATSADGGGGLLGNGTGIAGGQAFVNGGLGGIDEGTGGFGCGGGTSSWNNYRGGGGGGYSGGGGANNGGSCCPAGGGGGSFNGGLNPVDIAGVQLGDGLVRISSLTRYNDDAGIDQILGFAPPVCRGTYPVDVLAKNYGLNQVNSVTIGWSVNGVFQNDTTVVALIDTANGAGPDTLLVNLGMVNISAATTIRAWTVNPNAVTDSASWNDTLEVMIAEPAVINPMVDATISCNGLSDGAASVMGTGGTPGYNFLWSTGDTTDFIMGVPAGTYTAHLMDADGCTDSVDIVITEPDVLTSAVSANDVSCNGEMDGTIAVNPVGGTAGYLVMWSPGGAATFLDSLGAGTYSYMITDANGCTFMDSVVITEPAAIALSATTVASTGVADGEIDLTVSGGTPGYSFFWTNAATTEDLTGLFGGNYTVQVTDANGCTETLTVTVDELVGIDGFDDFAFQVYPNPSNGTFKVSVADAMNDITLEVMDVLGNRVQVVENAGNLTEFKLEVGAGVYMLRLSDGNRAVTQRLLITK